MHCLFANGILSVELDATMTVLNARGLAYEVLRQTAATGYHFRGDVSASRLRAALTPGREKTCHGGWKGFAAETLEVLAFCVMLVSKHSLEGLEETERWIIESLRAGWQVASASFASKYLYEGLSPDAAASAFQTAFEKFMTAHTRAHKDALLLPKHHYSCHLPGQVLRDGYLLDAWSLERKSKAAKAIATELTVTGSFCKQIMVRLLCAQIFTDKLAMGALEAPQQLDSMIVKGSGIRTKFGTISKGECWLHGTFAFILEAVYRIGNRCDLHVHVFRKVGIHESLILSDFQETGRIPMPDHMREATGWLRDSPTRLMVLDPFSCLTLRA